jgi:hypothetical protein
MFIFVYKYKYIAIELRDSLMISCQSADENGGLLKNAESATDYLDLLDILVNPLTFSGNIFELEDANRTISSVVKIDRLPKNNSLEALISLQDAWDHVDSYHQLADVYKIITKVSYFVLLMASMLTSVMAICSGSIDENYESQNGSIGDGRNTLSQYIILANSLLMSTIVGYVNFMNPALRWQQLRGDVSCLLSN